MINIALIVHNVNIIYNKYDPVIGKNNIDTINMIANNIKQKITVNGIYDNK
jgi:hypothetical protein